LEAARADHDAVLIGADDVIAAGRAHVMASKRSPVSLEFPSRRTKIVPFGMFSAIVRAIHTNRPDRVLFMIEKPPI
jgi:hypothetical protein